MTRATGFERHGPGSFFVNLDEPQRAVLLNLSEQLIEILAERVDHPHSDPLAEMMGISGHDSPPDDEVLLRLLPNAYADPVESADFRRFTESNLRAKKRVHAMVVRSNLLHLEKSTVNLDAHSALAWLGAINDFRLALGVRLNVEDNTFEQLELLSPDDPMRGVYAVYTWLGWMQESLVLALMDDATPETETQL
jgi:hypothetical protein